MQSIPQEVVDLILNCLCGYRRALKACSLVRRSWTQTSQRNLFHELRLGMAAEGFVADATCLESFPWYGVLFAAPIQRYIRHLTLAPSSGNEGRPLVLLGTILAIINSFPLLRSLTLQSLTLLSLPHEETMLSTDRGIDSLYINDSNVPSLAGHVLKPFLLPYHVQNVIISGIALGGGSPHDPSASATDVASVESLVVRSPLHTAYITNFFSRGSLRALQLTGFTPAGIRNLASFFTTGVHCLEHLTLDLSTFIDKTSESRDEHLRPLEINNCHVLMTLTLRFAFLAEPWAGLPSNDVALRVVSRLASDTPSSLRTLTLEVILQGKARTANTFLRPLSACIAKHFARLDEVSTSKPHLCTVRWLWGRACKWEGTGVKTGYLKACLTEAVVKQFPTLSGKGMLSFGEAEVDE